ncbi:O-antigen ligase family protein [Thiocapsa sp.]|uniref:O-antigen ligase family protein n=1 Tax=Thiocapsa sp. TaxID=2024551 RepID=UPI0025F3665B|nr:O-antigen ligase family protein [Thiocapsa sp.]
MLAIIALIPGFLSAWIGLTRGPHAAFLMVYLPTMLLLPEYYRWMAPGLPDPTFGQSAAIGTAVAFFTRGMPGYRFDPMDLLVFGFALTASISEYRASGYSDAQNLMFNMLTWVVLPYIFAKSLVEPAGNRVRFAKTLVVCLFIISVVSVYEFRFGTTPWRMILDPFFPGQARWVTTFRWGFARVAGPYGHAILAGIVLVVGYRIQRWLEWSGAWEPKPRFARWLPISQGRLITLGILAGVLMTMVRGPWIAAILAALLVMIGRSRQRTAAIAVVVGLLVFVGVPGVIWFLDYVSVGRHGAETVAQESAAYRWELLTKYSEIAGEKIWFGWGLNDWPKVPGMPSIDNYYLLLLLMHGLIAVLTLLAIMLIMLIRLIAHGMRQPLSEPRGSSLAFTLAGIYLAIFFSIATVYLGLQAVPLLFLITGWSVGYLNSGVEGIGGESSVAPEQKPPYRFSRIMA